MSKAHPRAATSPAARLRLEAAAVRLGFTWFGVRKTLSREQRSQAAEGFGAEGDCLSAAKKLLDTRHAAFRAVTAVRGRIVSYWRGLTLPYPEPGLRLIRQDRVADFDRQMIEMRQELSDAVNELDAHYEPLREAARVRLGRLYDARDYPDSLANLFAVAWEYPSVEPPDYLLRLRPELFEQERARVAAKFEEAVALAEQAFAAELSELVTHLADRLAGTADGKPKVFRDSAVANLGSFFNRFRQLNVRSNPQLDELVEEAKRVIAGAPPQELRENPALRQRIHDQLSGVKATLDGLLVEKPRRRLLRRSPAVSTSAGEGAAA